MEDSRKSIIVIGMGGLGHHIIENYAKEKGMDVLMVDGDHNPGIHKMMEKLDRMNEIEKLGAMEIKLPPPMPDLVFDHQFSKKKRYNKRKWPRR